MSKHTPGPWTPEYDDSVKVRASDGSGLCTINWLRGRHGEHGRIDGSEGEANARLIAAAPELLEALESVLDSLGAMTKRHELLDHMSEEEADRVFAAIAKARGEA